jgi:NAD(P)-dependent dehydrogenase (short-subunit alcohol dehydrogenase family)
LALGAFAGALIYRQGRRRPENLAGRVALITGGSRGLGLALAYELAAHGCRLALAARNEARLVEVRNDPRFASTEVATFACDVRDDNQTQALIADVVAHFGRIDILINNAGIIQVGPSQDMTLDDFREASDVMFWGPLHMILETLPHFRRQGSGCIVNITSIGGKVSVPHLLPYCAAKFAMVGLSEGLNAELG